MKFDIGAVFGDLVARFARLPMAQKVALPVLIGGTVLLVVFVSQWATKPDYTVLFSGLAESDAAGIVERLKDQKIGYRLADGGSTIEVTPPSMVHELRLEMASSGLPKGGHVGFELFDNHSWGRTALQEWVTNLRAVQGELERTISSIEAVKTVRVHITSPEKSSFVKKDILPTASVLLRLKAGAELTPQQVKGIANLVAGSVERLQPENVTILDSKGNLLNAKKEGVELADVDNSRLDYKRKIEESYSRQIESMLASVLGPGKAVARVSADLDFSSFQKEEEFFDPAGTVTRSERSVDDNATQSADGGVPGVVSNLTNNPALLTPPDSAKAGNRRRESVRNYEVSRAVSKTSSAAGKLNRLSVAVLVDGQYTTDNGASVYRPLSSDMIQKIENLVKQSVGFESGRGDTVTVENLQFVDGDSALEAALQAGEKTDWARMLPSVTALGIILALFLILWKLTNFLIKPAGAEVDLDRLLPGGMKELYGELESERSALRAVAQSDRSTVDLAELEALLGENSRLVKENPQQAALLIRYWLNEGQA